MKKAIFAGAVIVAGSSAAFATDTPLTNGSFELQPPPGFTQTITNWAASFTDNAGNPLAPPANFAGPPAQYSGLFTFFGTKYPPASVPNGTTYAMLANLGAGKVTLQSDAASLALPLNHNFAVVDRNLSFRYVYLTNEPQASALQDRFQVRVDFFATATSSVALGTSFTTTITPQAYKADSGIGISPFSSNGNNAVAVFNDSVGSGANAFNLFNIDISAGFGQFARVSFIVDNQNVTQNQANGNGLGVSGILLDNVLLNPEPSAIALFALGAMGLGGFAWRRRSAKKPTA